MSPRERGGQKTTFSSLFFDSPMSSRDSLNAVSKVWWLSRAICELLNDHDMKDEPMMVKSA